MTVVMQEQRVMISPDYVESCAAVIEKSGAESSGGCATLE